MIHLSISKIPFPHPLLSPAMDRQEQSDLTLAQKYDQLDYLRTVYDLPYAISLALVHNFIISATSLVKLLVVGHFRKHWQNYVRTWAAQPARKTRSLAGHQKMPAVPLSRTSDGSFMLSWSRQKNLPPEARKAWTEIAPFSGQQSLEWGHNL